MKSCPRCEAGGRAIEPLTLESQVAAGRLSQLYHHDGWRMCTSKTCPVVYFLGEDVVELGETKALPFHKSNDPKRLVCFCFEHSVMEVEADVRESGSSKILMSIKAACKAGLDDCERKNPQGRCCLGNVGAVVKRAAQGPKGDLVLSSDCCETPNSSDSAESTCEAEALEEGHAAPIKI